MPPSAEPVVVFGPTRGHAPGGLPVARAQYGGRPLCGEFVANLAVPSAGGRFLVLNRFYPVGTRSNVLLLLLALAPWAVALGTDWAPWLQSDSLGGLLMGLTMVVVLGVGLVLFWQLVARLRGRRLGSSHPYGLLLIDTRTGHVFAQRQHGRLLTPVRLVRAARMLPLRPSRRLRRYGRPWLIYCQEAQEADLLPLVVDNTSFRQLRPAQAFR